MAGTALPAGVGQLKEKHTAASEIHGAFVQQEVLNADIQDSALVMPGG
jgi:hypothetical protein